MRVLIIGAGGHAQVVADIILCLQEEGMSLDVAGYVDDDVSQHGKSLLGRPVLGKVESWNEHAHEGLIVGIGSNDIRRRIYTALSLQGGNFVNAVHPRSIVASGVEIGPGSVVCAGAVINIGSTVGANSILNTSCSVDHHCYIGDHAHVGPGSHLGGDVTIGNETLIGIGSVVLPQLHIGKRCIVGAGAVVRQNVSDLTTVVGVPARSIS